MSRILRVEPGLVTVPRFDRIPFLYHGFGNATWRRKDLRDKAEGKKMALVALRQVHSDIIRVIKQVPKVSLKGDAAIAALPGVFLVIKTADCLPVLLVDENKRVIAAVHCGWKGTLQRLPQKVIRALQLHFGCAPASILAALGPCISGDCYEVGGDVRRSFAREGFPDSLFRPKPGRSERYLFDLREANRGQLIQSGLRAKNIFSAAVCTHCDRAYPSYRRDQNETGRMLSFIGLSA